MIYPRKTLTRYTAAVALVVVGSLLRLALHDYLGYSSVFITFYPAVMAAAVVCGFGPGVLATFLSAAVVDYWLFAPFGIFTSFNSAGFVNLIFFSIMGIFMNAVAELYRKAREKAAVLEMELAKSKVDKRIVLLTDTASQLLQTKDPQGLVQSLCERVMVELDCQIFTNFLVDEERGCLHLNAFAGIPEDVVKSIEWQEYCASVSGCVVRDGCRTVAEDIFNTQDPRTELLKSYGIQSYACHPLLSEGGRVIGTLSFGSTSRARFDSDDLFLMKSVADQVATAMDKMRILDNERRRVEELQAIMDVVPVAVLVGNDPECKDITGNKQANEFYEAEQGENVSASTTLVRRYFQNGKEIAAEDLPMQKAAANDIEIRNVEFEVEMPSGKHLILLGNATPLRHSDGRIRGAVGAFMDITEQRELEAHKQEFYRRTILAATNGKLIICEPKEIEDLISGNCTEWDLQEVNDIAKVRKAVVDTAKDAGMPENRVYRFLGCVVEAAGNAVKHTGSGRARICRTKDSIIFVVSDSGPGIGAMSLPDVALTKGYSTAGTLGMGYKLMIQFADKLYLATDSNGTTLAIEMSLNPPAKALNYELPLQTVAWNG